MVGFAPGRQAKCPDPLKHALHSAGVFRHHAQPRSRTELPFPEPFQKKSETPRSYTTYPELVRLR